MRLEERFVTGRPLSCGGLLLVPLQRIRAHELAGWAGIGEAEVVGFIVRAGAAPPRLLALDQTLGDAAACNAWLAARPCLLAEIRAHLAAEG